MADALEFRSRMQELDGLLDQAESTGDPASQARVQEIARGLLDIHGAAFQRLLEHLAAAGESGAEILEAVARDEIVSPVLLLHGLHPLDLETRVRRALEKVAPYTASHGGHVELIAIDDDGTVRLQMEGSCHGCPSSRVTLQSSIEQEIYMAAPEVTAIAVEGLAEEEPSPPAGFVPIERMAINGNVTPAVAT